MRRTASASTAVRPVTALPSIPAVDSQPLPFHRLLTDPVDVGHHALGGIVTPASVDEMREILDVLNSADGSERAAQEAAEKRRKHREAMVLFRLRKKNNFGEMKKQEQSLQVVLQQKLREYRTLRDRRCTAVSTTQDEERLRQLHDDFADVLTMKESLLRENRAMANVINDLAKFHKLVLDETELLATEADGNEPAATSSSAPVEPASPPPKSPPGQWIQLLDDEPPIFYTPDPPATCPAIEHMSFERSKNLHNAFVTKQFDITETYCLGWTAQHSLGWSPDHTTRVLRFRFTRLVPRWFLALDDYRRLMWNAVQTPEINARFYSTPVRMKIVQWINDNTFITFRNSPDRNRSMNIRYFAANCRVDYLDEQQRRTCMIHHAILDRNTPVQAAPSETPIVWAKEGAQCMKFTEVEESDAIEIDHCGYMHCVSEEQARYLMIETCSVLMRWEQLVVPPRLLKSD
jgi:hypothetical protein